MYPGIQEKRKGVVQDSAQEGPIYGELIPLGKVGGVALDVLGMGVSHKLEINVVTQVKEKRS